MSQSKNQRCHCGSGKKYKKCCSLKVPERKIVEDNSEKNDTVEKYDDHDDNSLNDYNEKNLEDTKLLFEALNNFRKHSLGRKPHIKKYQRIITKKLIG